MKEIADLRDLLFYYVQELYSAEEQVMQVIPGIINKAHHSSLTNALTHHLNLTKDQKKRLELAVQLISDESTGNRLKSKQYVLDKAYVSKGMSGLLEEAKQLIESNISTEVTDAAIIGAVQKIEHYEICTYGTAIAYAAQLHLHKVQALLNETLTEEYDANDLLTSLAMASLNKEAEPEGMLPEDKTGTDKETSSTKATGEAGAVHTTERNISSPGGRAGTSHRRYPNGESRGH